MSTPGKVELSREMLESAAWRSLGIQERRVIDFLMIELMRHGEECNGFLLAPRRQLVAFGIRTHDISAAINTVERVGLVDCRRGVGREPSVYTLTWLSDGSEPSNRWRRYDPNAAAVVSTTVASTKPHRSEYQSGIQAPVVSTTVASTKPEPVEPVEPVVSAISGSAKQHSPRSKEEQDLPGKNSVGREDGDSVSHARTHAREEAKAAPANGNDRCCPAYVVSPDGLRICGRPVVGSGERCAEHALLDDGLPNGASASPAPAAAEPDPPRRPGPARVEDNEEMF